MKLSLKNISITLLFAGVLIITALAVGYVQSLPVKDALGATGGQFLVEWEYKRSGFENATSTTIATTSPTTLTAGASTTVTVATNGVSDIRLNLVASTSIATPSITIGYRTLGQNNVDYYDNANISASGGAITATGKGLVSWVQATTAKAHLVEQAAPKTSILFSNINADEVQFVLGSNIYTDLSIEIEKIYPRN